MYLTPFGSLLKTAEPLEKAVIDALCNRALGRNPIIFSEAILCCLRTEIAEQDAVFDNFAFLALESALADQLGVNVEVSACIITVSDFTKCGIWLGGKDSLGVAFEI